jgi:hypothetical protein
MKTGIKSKLSTDLGLIKRGVESQVTELDEFCGNQHSKMSEMVFEQKEGIKDLPHKILDGWEDYLLSRKRLVMNFSLLNLQQKTTRTRDFVSSFFLRPGIIKLHVVNFLLNVMYWVVRLFTLTIFVILVVGAVILVIYGLDAAIGWITELIENLRSKDPSRIPKGVE